MVRKQVNMRELTLSEDVLPRMIREGDLVDEYTEIIRAGAKDGSEMGLAVVFDDGITKWVADGVRRLVAQERIGITRPFVNLKKGSKQDAIWYAAGANLEHGVRLTRKEKAQAVRNILVNPLIASTFTAQAIAQNVGVSVSSVESMKRKIARDKGKEPETAAPPASGKTTGRPSREVARAKAEAKEQGKDPFVAAQKGQVESLLNSLQGWVRKAIFSKCLADDELEALRTALDDIRIPLKKALKRLGG